MSIGKRKIQRLCYASECECGALVEWHWLWKWKCLFVYHIFSTTRLAFQNITGERFAIYNKFVS